MRIGSKRYSGSSGLISDRGKTRSLKPWGPLHIITGSTILSAGMTFAVALLGATLLATREFGEFVMFLGTSVLVSSICDLGVTNRMVTSSSTKDNSSPGALSIFWAAQVWSYGILVTASLLLLSLTPISDYFNVSKAILFWGTLNGAVVGIGSFLLGILQARQEWGTRSRFVIVQATARLVGALVGIVMARAETAALGATFGASVGVLLTFRAISIDGKHPLLVVPTLGRAVQAWREARWFAVAIVSGALTSYFPVAAVGHLGGPDELAIFGLALQLSGGPALLLNSVMTFMLPQAVDRSSSLSGYIGLIRRTAIPVIMLIALGAAVAPSMVSIVFGPEFRPSIVPLEILLAATAFLVLANPFQFLHYRLKAERFLAYLDLWMFLVTVAVFIASAQVMAEATAASLAVLAGIVVPKLWGLGLLYRRRHHLRAPERGQAAG